MLKFINWIPIGISPKEWEGKSILWRDTSISIPCIKIIPPEFSRLSHHCGEIEVSGIEDKEALSLIPDFIKAQEESLREKDRIIKILLEKLSSIGIDYSNLIL